MKKIFFIILPSLFLLLGAGINKDIGKENQKILKDLKTELEKSKESSKEKNNTLEENYSTAKEITLENTIVLQDGKDIKVEQKTFKLNLPKSKYLLLYGLRQGEKSIITTHDKNVVWKWENISSKYFYKVHMKLDDERNCLFITLTPTQSWPEEKPITATTEKEQAFWHVSYAMFNLSKEENSIFFDGQAFGINNNTFHRPILYIE